MKKHSAPKGTKKSKKTLPKVDNIGIKRLVGRDIFDPEFHPEDFVQHCREGTTRTEILAAWGISSSTLRNWILKFPEMKKAHRLGKEACKAYWLMKLRQSIMDDDRKKFFRMFNFLWFSKNVLGFSDDGGDDFQGADSVEFTVHDQETNKTTNAKGEEVDGDE